MISSQTIAETLLSLIEDDGHDPKRIVDQFIAFAEKSHIVNQIPSIVRSLEAEVEKRKAHDTLRLETAHTVSEDVVNRIRAFVGASSDIRIKTSINPDLVGGFTARYQGRVYDGSVRCNLERMKKELLAV